MLGLQHSNLKSARAWRLKQVLREVYAQAVQSNSVQTAEAALRALRMRAALDNDGDPTCIKVGDASIALVRLIQHQFYGGWNYAVASREPDRIKKQPRKLRRKL